MSASRPSASPASQLVGSLLVFVSLAGVVCGMTLLYLGMRNVMEIGGSCGSGGPYVYRQPCPEGVPLAMMGGIWGGVLMLGVYLWQTLKRGIPSLIWLAWPALFLSLGWNFLESGLNAPGNSGVAWGWLVCGVVFGLMGGVPLLLFGVPIARAILPLSGRAGGSSAKRAVSEGTDSWPAPPRYDRQRRNEAARLAGLILAVGNRVRPSSISARSSAPPPGQPTEGSRIVAALDRLSALREAGSLTEEEFVAAKRRVLEEHS